MRFVEFLILCAVAAWAVPTHTALVSSPSLSDCSSPSYIGYTHIPSLIPTCSYFFLHSAMGMMVVSASTTVLADSIALG